MLSHGYVWFSLPKSNYDRPGMYAMRHDCPDQWSVNQLGILLRSKLKRVLAIATGRFYRGPQDIPQRLGIYVSKTSSILVDF
jgi:hypothetical protein